MSNPTLVRLSCVVLWLSWGFDNWSVSYLSQAKWSGKELWGFPRKSWSGRLKLENFWDLEPQPEERVLLKVFLYSLWVRERLTSDRVDFILLCHNINNKNYPKKFTIKILLTRNFSWLKIFANRKYSLTKIFCDKSFSLTKLKKCWIKIFAVENFSLTKIFMNKILILIKIFLPKKFLTQKFSYNFFFLPKIFYYKKKSCTKYLFWPKLFLTKNISDHIIERPQSEFYYTSHS